MRPKAAFSGYPFFIFNFLGSRYLRKNAYTREKQVFWIYLLGQVINKIGKREKNKRNQEKYAKIENITLKYREICDK